MKTILYTAAHSGFNLHQVPLGGGASICQHLDEAWGRTKPFPYQILGPALLQKGSPQNKDLVRYSEWEYARFCRTFEHVTTDRILQHNPRETVILCNDESEGPNFRTLGEKGYRLYTIYHVDVVDYFATIYLHGLISPEKTTRAHRWLVKKGLGGLLPDVLKLVWEKQADSVRYSHGLIVPSCHMKEVLLRCYPDLPASKVHVMPWGIWRTPVVEGDVERDLQSIRARYPAEAGALKLLLLSRISPEKGQHLLLEAMHLWEQEVDYPAGGVVVYLSGEAAYMMGAKYEYRLKMLAARLKKTRVHFIGYAAGPTKEALFKLCDIYVFPSIHESYGLTMMEAVSAGLPLLTTASYGAKEIFRPEMGEMVAGTPAKAVSRNLLDGLRRLLAKPKALYKITPDAAWRARYDFSATASKLAALLASQ